MADPLPPVPRPIWVNLESTLGCNLECVMCGSFLSGVTKRRRIMDPALMDRVAAQVLPDAMDLQLTVAGEPFMTPKLSAFVELAEESGAQLQMNSNATLIKDGPLLRRILQNASVIKFSIDGATREVYESIRGESDWDRVMANIRMVVAVRDALPAARRARLALAMVLMRRNVHQLPDMVDLAAELGVERLEVAYLTAFTPAMEGESLRLEPALAARYLRAARARADRLGIAAALPPTIEGERLPPGLRGRVAWVRQEVTELSRRRLGRLARTARQRARVAAWSRRAGGRVPCKFLMGGVFVSIGGDVAPCPMPGRPVVGNLLERDFDAIWNGPTLTAMRRGLIEGRPFECCAHCSQNPAVHRPGDPETVRPRENSLPKDLGPRPRRRRGRARRPRRERATIPAQVSHGEVD